MKRPHQRVLVADRDPIAARTVAAFLRSRDYEVDVVGTARAVLDQPVPDVLIASASLPDQDVFELCEQLEQCGSLPWTIVTGAHLAAHDYRRAMRLGVRDLLATPVALDDLLRSVEAAAQTAPSQRLRVRSSLQLTYDCQPQSFGRILRELLAFALRSGLGPTARARIGTACAEVLENAWEHGYQNAGGPLHVRATVSGHDFEVELRDEGVGFDACTVAAVALDGSLDSGLARAGSLAEDLRLQSQPGHGATVHLTFAAYRVDFDDEFDSLDLSDWDYLAPEFSRRLGDQLLAAGETSAMNLSPALAVVVGRMLAGPTPMVRAMRTLWSA